MGKDTSQLYPVVYRENNEADGEVNTMSEETGLKPVQPMVSSLEPRETDLEAPPMPTTEQQGSHKARDPKFLWFSGQKPLFSGATELVKDGAIRLKNKFKAFYYKK